MTSGSGPFVGVPVVVENQRTREASCGSFISVTSKVYIWLDTKTMVWDNSFDCSCVVELSPHLNF